nr:sensor histidine kinase [Methylobacterium oxalidis]
MSTEDTDLRQRLQAEAARADEAEARCTELQHQTRNLLAVIRSVARRSAETSESVEEYAMHLDGRLTALARAQGALSSDPRARLDLHSLISDELLSYHAKEGEQVSLSGPRILLQPGAAATLGLAFHELATNAIKFGALTRDEGRISVSWKHADEPEPHLVITWREQHGPSVTPPKRKGFGMALFERMLPYELKAHAKLSFEPEGLRCTIEVPLSDRVIVDEGTA